MKLAQQLEEIDAAASLVENYNTNSLVHHTTDEDEEKIVSALHIDSKLRNSRLIAADDATDRIRGNNEHFLYLQQIMRQRLLVVRK